MLTIFFLFLIDRLIKDLILSKYLNFESKFFKLELFKNSQLFFLNINQRILILVSFIVLAVIIATLIKRENNQVRIGLLFLIVGGVSNLFDRLIYGYVIDYFWIFVFPFFYFKIADLMITSGLVLGFFGITAKKKKLLK